MGDVKISPESMRDYILSRAKIIDQALGERILRLVHAEHEDQAGTIFCRGKTSDTMINLDKVGDSAVERIWKMVLSHENHLLQKS